MPESDSNRKRSRSRSPSDSEQPKQHKRANTGAGSLSDDPSALPTSNTHLTPTSASAAANDVNMTDPSSTTATDSATSATADTAKGSTESTNSMATSSHPNASTSAAPTTSTAVTPPSAHIHMRCLIVTQDASIIIGKAGAHVNEIREKSGARVMVSESIPGNPERILNVSGPLDAVSKVGFVSVFRPQSYSFSTYCYPLVRHSVSLFGV
jgi:heterogeneous nuclear rnp K-like protein